MIKDKNREVLFNRFFRSEKERLTSINSDLNLLYNAESRSLTYKNSNGQLIVAFNNEEKSEEFYYRAANAPKGASIGNKVFEIRLEENSISGIITDEFYKMPEEFIDICDTYQYDRKNFDFDLNELHKKNKNKEEFTR